MVEGMGEKLCEKRGKTARRRARWVRKEVKIRAKQSF
jgi:hypothetical protein